MAGLQGRGHAQPVAEQMSRVIRKPIGHSYGIGCSNGGRHAMVAAARMPDAFDGLLIVVRPVSICRAPGCNMRWMCKASRVDDDIRKAFSADDLAAGGQFWPAATRLTG